MRLRSQTIRRARRLSTSFSMAALLGSHGMPATIADLDLHAGDYAQARDELAMAAFRDPSLRPNPRMPLVAELHDLLHAAHEVGRAGGTVPVGLPGPRPSMLDNVRYVNTKSKRCRHGAVPVRRTRPGNTNEFHTKRYRGRVERGKLVVRTHPFTTAPRARADRRTPVERAATQGGGRDGRRAADGREVTAQIGCPPRQRAVRALDDQVAAVQPVVANAATSRHTSGRTLWLSIVQQQW